METFAGMLTLALMVGTLIIWFRGMIIFFRQGDILGIGLLSFVIILCEALYLTMVLLGLPTFSCMLTKNLVKMCL